MLGTPQRRIGRPTKPPARRAKRIKLGLVVSAEIKRQLDKTAKDSGLSLSQEVERRVAESFRYETVLGPLNEANDRVREIAIGKVEAALRRAGWGSYFEPRYGGDVWAPPGRRPRVKPAEYTPPPLPLRAQALEQQSLDTDTEIKREQEKK